MCGSYFTACAMLESAGINPAEVNGALGHNYDYDGLTEDIAAKAIEAYRTKHNRPH